MSGAGPAPPDRRVRSGVWCAALGHTTVTSLSRFTQTSALWPKPTASGSSRGATRAVRNSGRLVRPTASKRTETGTQLGGRKQGRDGNRDAASLDAHAEKKA